MKWRHLNYKGKRHKVDPHLRSEGSGPEAGWRCYKCNEKIVLIVRSKPVPPPVV